jgi:hypothetical protein
LAVVASAVLCLWEGHRDYVAHTDANVALRQLSLVSADAREVAAIHAAAPPESRRHKPPAGLATHVADVISRSGLTQSTLQNLSPETESGLGATGLRKETAKLTLEPLTLAELGRFLQEWRAAEPIWTVASIDITPTPTPTRGRAATDRPLRAVIGIETVFANDASKEGNR